jgi:hypothetical protein
MLAAYGVDVLDPDVSTRRVKVLLDRVPPSARRGGEQWSTEADLLAALIDHVAYLTWVTLKAHGAKGAAKPKPVPRPKRSPVNAAAESARKRAVDAARAQPRALAGTVTEAPAKAASWADAILAIAKVPGVRTERDATSLRPPRRSRHGRHHPA